MERNVDRFIKSRKGTDSAWASNRLMWLAFIICPFGKFSPADWAVFLKDSIFSFSGSSCTRKIVGTFLSDSVSAAQTLARIINSSISLWASNLSLNLTSVTFPVLSMSICLSGKFNSKGPLLFRATFRLLYAPYKGFNTGSNSCKTSCLPMPLSTASWTSLYSSDAEDWISARVNLWLSLLPCESIFIFTIRQALFSPSCRLQRSPDKLSGSIGTTLSGK